jgi:hypothetical protein
MVEALRYKPSSSYEQLRRRAHGRIDHFYLSRELYSRGRIISSQPVRYDLGRHHAIPTFEGLDIDAIVASGSSEVDVIFGSTLNALNEAAFLDISRQYNDNHGRTLDTPMLAIDPDMEFRTPFVPLDPFFTDQPDFRIPPVAMVRDNFNAMMAFRMADAGITINRLLAVSPHPYQKQLFRNMAYSLVQNGIVRKMIILHRDFDDMKFYIDREFNDDFSVDHSRPSGETSILPPSMQYNFLEDRIHQAIITL